MSDEDDFESGTIHKVAMRFTVDFNEWRKHPIRRSAAMRWAWSELRQGRLASTFRCLLAAVRGWYRGTIYNAGA